MAIYDVIGQPSGAIRYTKEVDILADASGLPNSTYFYNRADGLTYYKNIAGTIIGLFQDISGKEDSITAGTSAQYWRGDKTFQTLNTTAVPEGTNLYYTNSRGIGSVLTGYVSGAGSISATDSLLSAVQKLDGNIAGLSAVYVPFTGSPYDVEFNQKQLTNISQLEVGHSTLGTDPYITINTANTNSSGLVFRNAGVNKWGVIRPSGTNDLAFRNAVGYSQFKMLQTGESGFGTENPLAKLHISNGAILLDNNNDLSFILSDLVSVKTILRTNSSNYTELHSAANGIIFKDNTNVEKMRMDNSGNLGIGTLTPSSKFNLHNGAFYSSDISVAHGMTTIVPTNVFGRTIKNSLDGGFNIAGLSSGINTALGMTAYIGASSPTVPAIIIGAVQSNGTGIQDLAATDILLRIRNNLASRVNILGDGSIWVGTATGSNNAILDLTSTTKAFLPPRMTTAQRDAVASPTDGMFVYNSTTGAFNGYQAGSWSAIGGASIYTASGTVPSGVVATLTDNLTFQNGQVKLIGQGTTSGTTDFVVHNSTGTNNSMRILGNGNVGLGLDVPLYAFHVERSGGQIVTSRSGSTGLYVSQDAINTSLFLYNGATQDIGFNSGTGNCWFDQTGNVGIGTKTPSSKLTIVKNGAQFETSRLGVTGVYINQAAAVTDINLYSPTVGGQVDTKIVSGTGDTYFNQIGNTAIGATSMAYKFGVTGTSGFTGQINMLIAAPLAIKSGTNQRAGNATLVGGTITISNTTVTANTLVNLTRKTSGGTIGMAVNYTLSAGASFTITSDNVLDTSTYTYLLIESN